MHSTTGSGCPTVIRKYQFFLSPEEGLWIWVAGEMMDVFATSWCHPLLLPGIPSLNFSTIFNASTSPSPYGLAPESVKVLLVSAQIHSIVHLFNNNSPFIKLIGGKLPRIAALSGSNPPNRCVSGHQMGQANFNLSSLLFSHHHTRSPCRWVLLFLEQYVGIFLDFADPSAFGVS